MLIDWAIYGLLIWVVAALINFTAFRDKPCPRLVAWLLTAAMFFVNLVALTAIQFLHYQVLSDSLGFEVRPRGPVDAAGAVAFSWMFFVLLRKMPRRLTVNPPPPQPGSPETIGVAPKEGAKSISAAPMTTLPSFTRPPTSGGFPAKSEEELWALALSEYEGNGRRPGLWAKVFAENGGSEAAAQAAYLGVRFAELNMEQQAAYALHVESGEKEKQAARAEKAKQDAIAFAHLPDWAKGSCPNCSALVLSSASGCLECGANFQSEGAWKPVPLKVT